MKVCESIGEMLLIREEWKSVVEEAKVLIGA
jgi:hypothetical protein